MAGIKKVLKSILGMSHINSSRNCPKCGKAMKKIFYESNKIITTTDVPAWYCHKCNHMELEYF